MDGGFFNAFPYSVQFCVIIVCLCAFVLHVHRWMKNWKVDEMTSRTFAGATLINFFFSFSCFRTATLAMSWWFCDVVVTLNDRQQQQLTHSEEGRINTVQTDINETKKTAGRRTEKSAIAATCDPRRDWKRRRKKTKTTTTTKTKCAIEKWRVGKEQKANEWRWRPFLGWKRRWWH